MSMLWALTGGLDTRLVADGRAADVAFDNFVATNTINSEEAADMEEKEKTKVKNIFFYYDNLISCKLLYHFELYRIRFTGIMSKHMDYLIWNFHCNILSGDIEFPFSIRERIFI